MTTTSPAAQPGGSPASGGSDDGFRGPQVCEIVGITYRQLDYWARTNLLRPSIADAKGSGSQRRYSYRDLVELKVIKSLIDGGVSLQAARTAIEYLRDNLGEQLASVTFVISGSTPVLVNDAGELIDMLRNGQGMLNVLPLGPVVDDLEATLIRFASDASDASVGRASATDTVSRTGRAAHA
jgi:DNA-binding transcriptional MerR regulator